MNSEPKFTKLADRKLADRLVAAGLELPIVFSLGWVFRADRLAQSGYTFAD